MCMFITISYLYVLSLLMYIDIYVFDSMSVSMTVSEFSILPVCVCFGQYSHCYVSFYVTSMCTYIDKRLPLAMCYILPFYVTSMCNISM